MKYCIDILILCLNPTILKNFKIITIIAVLICFFYTSYLICHSLLFITSTILGGIEDETVGVMPDIRLEIIPGGILGAIVVVMMYSSVSANTNILEESLLNFLVAISECTEFFCSFGVFSSIALNVLGIIASLLSFFTISNSGRGVLGCSSLIRD